MDKRKLGLAAASLLGAATMMTASPAHADELITCPCTVEPGADPFVKIEASFLKIMSKFDDGSIQVARLGDAFSKIQTAFFKIG